MEKGSAGGKIVCGVVPAGLGIDLRLLAWARLRAAFGDARVVVFARETTFTVVRGLARRPSRSSAAYSVRFSVCLFAARFSVCLSVTPKYGSETTLSSLQPACQPQAAAAQAAAAAAIP